MKQDLLHTDAKTDKYHLDWPLFGWTSDIRSHLGPMTQDGRDVMAVDDFDGLFLMLGDMPCIPGALIDTMAAALRDPDQIVVPVNQGRRGHPVLFGRSWFADLLQLSGDVGARDVIERARHLVEIACDDDGIFLDIDRPADLAAAAKCLPPDR